MMPAGVLASASHVWDWDGVPIADMAGALCVVFDKPGGRIVRGTFPLSEGCAPLSREEFDKLLSSSEASK